MPVIPQWEAKAGVSLGYRARSRQVRVAHGDPGSAHPTPCKKKRGPVGTLPPSRHLFPLCPFPVPTVPCACLLAPASWMPSQRCPARSHAGSQRPCNSAQGELLHGWLRWRLHHLVKNRATPVPGKTSHTFSTSHNVTALVILT